jgi:hypothetical protein
MRRLAGVTLLILGLSIVAAPIASAHYQLQDGRWMFYGATYAKTDGHLVDGDPVNIFWYPWAHTCQTDQMCDVGERVTTHLRQHWRPKWASEDEMADHLKCKDHNYMNFRYTNWFPKDDFQGSGFVPGNQDIPGLSSCGNRYHMRLWSDRNAALDDHTEAKSWIVGNVHHERVVIKACCPPTIKKHKIDIDWDLVEFAAAKKMRRPPISPGHLDHAGRGGGHCTDYKWKPVPGSAGKRGGRFGRPSDGFITRISLSHCPS